MTQIAPKPSLPTVFPPKILGLRLGLRGSDVTGQRGVEAESARSQRRPIGSLETIRAVAVLLLVNYHVIGADPGSGLKLDYPHPLRIYADLLIDTRMPLFAMISGIVYALRPVDPDRLPGFLLGKLRRLAIPGIIAITIFAVLSTIMGTNFAVRTSAWTIYLFSYAHFWFLQVILVIFFSYVVFDILTRGRFLLPSLAVVMVLILSTRLPLPRLFSVSTVPVLLPYFILGIVLARNGSYLVRYRTWLVAAALLAVVAGLMLNLQDFGLNGKMSTDRLDVQSFLFGGGTCVAALLLFPEVPILARIGGPSFTIYLYHVIGTSGTRRFLEFFGVQHIGLHLLLGTAAGLAIGIIIHRVAQTHPLSRLIILGERTKRDQTQIESFRPT